MADNWIQVLKKRKKEKEENVYILLSVVPEPRYSCEITIFGSWPQSRHSEGLNIPNLKYKYLSVVLAMHKISVKTMIKALSL